jgi:hypothetical protein
MIRISVPLESVTDTVTSIGEVNHHDMAANEINVDNAEIYHPEPHEQFYPNLEIDYMAAEPPTAIVNGNIVECINIGGGHVNRPK